MNFTSILVVVHVRCFFPTSFSSLLSHFVPLVTNNMNQSLDQTSPVSLCFADVACILLSRAVSLVLIIMNRTVSPLSSASLVCRSFCLFSQWPHPRMSGRLAREVCLEFFSNMDRMYEELEAKICVLRIRWNSPEDNGVLA